VLLFVGLTSIGFTRFEDRAIIGVPGSPASAMAAFAVSDEDTAESYSEAPDELVALNNIARAPTNRIRRVLRDRDIPAGASRQIIASGPPENPFISDVQNGAGAGPVAGQEFAPLDAPTASPAALASLAPPLAGQGPAVFNAPLTGGGDNGGGSGGGGGEPPPPPPPPPPLGPVSPIPEPGTWLMLMLGLFGIGAALRHRSAGDTNHAVCQID
jgi:hypothetical protein